MKEEGNKEGNQRGGNEGRIGGKKKRREKEKKKRKEGMKKGGNLEMTGKSKLISFLFLLTIYFTFVSSIHSKICGWMTLKVCMFGAKMLSLSALPIRDVAT